MPELNKCWYADRIVQVRLKYDLTIDQREADVLESVLSACESTDMVFTECAAGRQGASTGIHVNEDQRTKLYPGEDLRSVRDLSASHPTQDESLGP